jgi:hypothetical protein
VGRETEVQVPDVQPRQPAALADLDHLRAELLDRADVAGPDPLDAGARRERHERRPEMAEPLGDRRGPARVLHGHLGPRDRAGLVPDEREHAREVPQRPLGLEDLRGPQAGLDPLGELGEAQVVDRLHVEDVGEGALVADRLRELTRLRERRGRALVVAGEAHRPCRGARDAGAVGARRVAEGRERPLRHLDRLLEPGRPREVVHHRPPDPADRVGAAERLVQVERLVHRPERYNGSAATRSASRITRSTFRPATFARSSAV